MAKKSKKAKAEQFRLSCMFCGDTGSSREHYIPTWSHKYFEHIEPRLHTSDIKFSFKPVGVDPPIVEEKERKSGRSRIHDPIRQVCETCNNTWMGNIVNAAKGALERYAFPSGVEPTQVISPEEQMVMARWAVLTALTYVNYKEPGSITRFDLDHIRRHGSIPPGWQVAMARMDHPGWNAVLIHDVINGVFSGEIRPLAGPYMMICLINSAFFVWKATPGDLISMLARLNEPAFRAIYPPFGGGPLRWIDMPVLTAERVEALELKVVQAKLAAFKSRNEVEQARRNFIGSGGAPPRHL